eukprot:3324993-Prorocentrum_lima.AAC.1
MGWRIRNGGAGYMSEKIMMGMMLTTKETVPVEDIAGVRRVGVGRALLLPGAAAARFPRPVVWFGES